MVSVRDGTLADVEACLKIDRSFPNDRVLVLDISQTPAEHNITLRWESTKLTGARRAHVLSRDQLISDIENAARFWVVEIDGAIVGFALLRRVDWQPDTGDITSINVDAHQRHQGAGTALVEIMKGYARQEALRGIFWEAQTDNYEALTFALHQGFEFAGLNTAFYNNTDYRRQRKPDFTGIAVFLFWQNDGRDEP
jgi:N-acetylglutamate synthase-like GNAT family acetyltransferase